MVDIKDLKEQVLFEDLTNVRRMNQKLMNILVSY